MISTNLFENSDARKITSQRGPFSVLEFERDVSVSPDMAQTAYFASEMNVRKKQLIAKLNADSGVLVQAHEMQLMVGQVEAETNVKSAGDFFKKIVGSRLTGETVLKPYYHGDGLLVLEPTFKFIILEDVGDWEGGMTIEDGMFLASEATVDLRLSARHNASSLLLGREGVFNTTLYGRGVVALESEVPREELIEVNLVDDEVRIDGNMAIAWSETLEFTVEKTTSTLIGSFASGEGLVNVYRGTGKVLVAPVRRNWGISTPAR